MKKDKGLSADKPHMGNMGNMAKRDGELSTYGVKGKRI